MRASDFNIKKRDPNWKTLQAKRTSNAAGAHKDKKKAEKNGDVKHKNKEMAEDINESYSSMPPDALRTMLHVYEKESQGVKQHDDKEGADRIGYALNDAAKELGVSKQLKSLYNAAAHSAHMDFDTNPGDFKNWFPYVGELLKGLYDLQKEKGAYDNDEPDTLPDEEKMSERFRDPEDWDEGNTEPANNFAVYINGKKWKVFKGRGYYADDFREKQHYQQLKAWADKKSAATGKKWTVHVTGEPATE